MASVTPVLIGSGDHKVEVDGVGDADVAVAGLDGEDDFAGVDRDIQT